MSINLELISPGMILWEEFMDPMNISQNQLSRDIDVTPGQVNDIIHGKRSIKADVALRLSKYFGNTPEFWLNLQLEYDLRKSKREEWPLIESRIRTYSPNSLKRRGKRGLKPHKVA
ncbi:MAG: HigA family addiction module antitoxin [Alphaproteobacteria bacterium]